MSEEKKFKFMMSEKEFYKMFEDMMNGLEESEQEGMVKFVNRLRKVMVDDSLEPFIYNDELYEKAVELVKERKNIRVKTLQEYFGISYFRAYILIEKMLLDEVVEKNGYFGDYKLCGFDVPVFVDKETYYKKIESLLNNFEYEDDKDFARQAFRKHEEYIALNDFSHIDDIVYNVYEDELYEKILDFVKEIGKCSISLLQRKFDIGYARAGALKDRLEEEGIIMVKELPDGKKTYVLKK